MVVAAAEGVSVVDEGVVVEEVSAVGVVGVVLEEVVEAVVAEAEEVRK